MMNTVSFFFFSRRQPCIIYVCIGLCWVFIAAPGLSLVRVRGLLTAVASLGVDRGLWGRAGSRVRTLVVMHGLSRPEACGIFPDQGLNLCPLHRQVDS